MNFLVFEPGEEAAFVAKVGPHEEIRPVPGTGPFEGNFVLQADIALAGEHYAREVRKPQYRRDVYAADGAKLPGKLEAPEAEAEQPE